MHSKRAHKEKERAERFIRDAIDRIRNDPQIRRMFDGWDDIVPTSECRHCQGTGLGPGDGKTECGFCQGESNE